MVTDFEKFEEIEIGFLKKYKLKEREIKMKKHLKTQKKEKEEVLNFKMFIRSPDPRNYYEGYRGGKETRKLKK